MHHIHPIQRSGQRRGIGHVVSPDALLKRHSSNTTVSPSLYLPPGLPHRTLTVSPTGSPSPHPHCISHVPALAASRAASLAASRARGASELKTADRVLSAWQTVSGCQVGSPCDPCCQGGLGSCACSCTHRLLQPRHGRRERFRHRGRPHFLHLLLLRLLRRRRRFARRLRHRLDLN
jgi:hypothetical protein